MNFREQEKQQLTIFYGGKVLVFNDFPADKAKGLMQMASKGNPVVQNVSAPATVTDSTKIQAAVAPESSLPGAQADAQKPARPNTSGNYPVLSYCSISIWLLNVHLAESYYAAD
jgi:jasmonate ZIM domain-containing protein